MKAGIAPMKYMRHYLYIKGNKNHIFIDIYKYKYMTNSSHVYQFK